MTKSNLIKLIKDKIIVEKDGSFTYRLEIPQFYDDSDLMTIWIEEMNDKHYRLIDRGFTLIKLSYYNDGIRYNKYVQDIVKKNGVKLLSDSLYIDVKENQLVMGIIKLIQCITELMMISYFNKKEDEKE